MTKYNYRRVGNRVIRTEAGRAEDDFERNYAVGLAMVLTTISGLIFLFGGGAALMGITAFGHAVGASISPLGYWASVFYLGVSAVALLLIRLIFRRRR